MSQILGQVTPTSRQRTSTSAFLEQIRFPIADALAEVESVLRDELRPGDPWIADLLSSSTLTAGKRIRPTLLLLVGSHLGPLSPDHLTMAAAVEMVHVATLVHDDLIDGAGLRRHRPTVNRMHGHRQSVLLGDYLFTHSFSIASRCHDSRQAVSILANSSNRVCEGEIRQNFHQGDLQLSQKDYLQIISDKTGELCAAACHLGAVISGSNEQTRARFEVFGRELGTAFQIIDDLLDVRGSQKSTGKTLGTDLSNLKLTLPLIHCRDSLSGKGRENFLVAVKSGDVAKVTHWLEQTGSVEFAREYAGQKVQYARTFAKSLERSDSSAALLALIDFVIERNS